MTNEEPELHEIGKQVKKLLEQKGYSLVEVRKRIEAKIKALEKKSTIKTKKVWTKELGHRLLKIGKRVTHIQSNFPVKFFVLEEVQLEGESEPEFRIGYDMISPKKLKEQGKLQIVWGQYNPLIPKSDFKKLVELAQESGML